MPSLLEAYEVPEIISTLDPSIPLISPSQFNHYNRCAWSWHFRYVRGFFPIPTNDSSEVGLLVHKVAEVGYKAKQDFPRESNSFYIKKVKEALTAFASTPGMTMDQMIQLRRAGRVMLRYFEDQAPEWDHGATILGVEKHFVVLLFTPKGNPFYLQGYIDLLLSYGRTVFVDDFKSTDQKQRFYTKDQVQMDAQLKSYVLALNEMGYDCSNVAIRNINTYEYKRDFESKSNQDLFARTPAHYSIKEMETFRREIGHLVDEAFYTPTNPFRRTISRDCANCWIKEACLFDQKGMDLTLLLKKKYQRRALTETTKDLIIGVDRGIKNNA